jgi:hypothetical protein
MSSPGKPDLSLFIDILNTLEKIGAPYMIIGAFAGAVYGITRVTYDIDIVVDLTEAHINALADTYPLPRYYADPEMMHNSIEMGIMFNIIDTHRGEKADLVPLSLSYRYAFQRRIRQLVEIPGADPFSVWIARPEDVIVGKLMAWAEDRSHKHETDILEMMVFRYLEAGTSQSPDFDEAYIDRQADQMGVEVSQFWRTVKETASREASKPT